MTIEMQHFASHCVTLFSQADSQCFVSGFMVLTIFALFAPDLDLLLGTVQSQHALRCLAMLGSSEFISPAGLIMTVACFFFLVEILVQSIGKEGRLGYVYMHAFD